MGNVKSLEKSIVLKDFCDLEDISEIKKTLTKLGLSSNLSDGEIFEYFDKNKEIREYILNLINICIQKNKKVSNNFLVFVKRYPKSYQKELKNPKSISLDKSIGFVGINSFKDEKIKTGKDFEYLVVDSNSKFPCNGDDISKDICKDGFYKESFYPDYIFYNQENYIKTKDKLSTTDVKNIENEYFVKLVENSVIYKKLQSKYIYNLNNLEMWVIITKEGCPYCKNAKKLLNEKNINYKEYDINSNREEILKETDFYTDGYRKVPMVFTYDVFIGGYNDLKNYKFSS